MSFDESAWRSQLSWIRTTGMFILEFCRNAYVAENARVILGLKKHGFFLSFPAGGHRVLGCVHAKIKLKCVNFQESSARNFSRRYMCLRVLALLFHEACACQRESWARGSRKKLCIIPSYIRVDVFFLFCCIYTRVKLFKTYRAHHYCKFMQFCTSLRLSIFCFLLEELLICKKKTTCRPYSRLYGCYATYLNYIDNCELGVHARCHGPTIWASDHHDDV